MKRWIATALLGSAAAAFAQTPASAPPAASASAPAPLPSSPAKKELVKKLLALQQPGIENIARNMVERPAMAMMQQASQILQTQVPPEKREATGKAIQAELKAYDDEAVAVARDRAIKLAPSTIGAEMEARFTEDELKAIVAWFESPISKKYQQNAADVQDGFMRKLSADVGPVLQPKLQNLEEKTRVALGLPATPADAASAPPATTKPAAKPATKPAQKPAGK
ncbi:MAG: DUF2059 domain-containing protein [Proteobacteria bacterium]|nr:DUF2059 domain-containing protein [Pseudomonadota bacterium]